MTRRPNGSTKLPSQLAEGSVSRTLPRGRPHPDAERPTRELDREEMAELVRAAGEDKRKTRRFDPEELRSLGILVDAHSEPPVPSEPVRPATPRTMTPRMLLTGRPLVVVERYRKPATTRSKTRPKPR